MSAAAVNHCRPNYNTVAVQVERLLPRGSRGANGSRRPSWKGVPYWPPDVFGVTATLIERSGAYRHVIGPTPGDDTRPFESKLAVARQEEQGALTARGLAWGWGLLGFTPDRRSGSAWEAWLSFLRASLPSSTKGPSWKDLLEIDLSPIQEDWYLLLHEHGDEPVLRDGTSIDPGWWAPAMRLLITADAASAGIGFRPRHSKNSARSLKEKHAAPTWVQLTLLHSVTQQLGEIEGQRVDSPFITTVTSDIYDSNLGSVLPKTRTSPLGCTLRSLTHHLALLPPPGTVEARWRIPGKEAPPIGTRAGDHFEPKPLNLLLIPFPYRINPGSFRAVGHCSDNGWGYFEVDQSWLRSDLKPRRDPDPDNIVEASGEELLHFVRSLMDAGKRELGEVNAVVFPELSLDWGTFERISEDLLSGSDGTIEFIVAGLSEMPPDLVGTDIGHGRPCNYAAFRGGNPHGNPSDRRKKGRKSAGGEPAARPEWLIRGGREKHHRWKLNRSQIERYGLSHKLESNSNWWEAIPISRRVVDFFEIRAGSSMTVLICEDLARADPCQTVVRSIGPNLVIALLMDGPQRVFRWPAHYAGVLADDPGSTVLTLTSFGLIERGLVTDETHSRSVALFKDGTSNARELQLPPGCHALAIRLEAAVKTEHTLDGRGDNQGAFIWKLRQVCPVSGEGASWITGR